MPFIESADDSALQTNAAKQVSPFRLLDLPAELRAQVYASAADQALAIPFMVAHNVFEDWVDDDDPAVDYWILEQQWLEHESRRLRRQANPFALISTCKKIYNEASVIFYSKMEVDLRLLHLASSLWKMTLFTDLFKPNLKFVQHLELDAETAAHLLLAPAESEGFSEWSSELVQLYLTKDKHADQLRWLRTFLYDLRSITIYPDPVYTHALCLPFMADWALQILADYRHLTQLSRLYPRLADITCITAFGVERFRGTDSGRWELWYSREAIPVEEGKVPHFPHLFESFDDDTGLMLPTTLGSIQFVEL